MKKSILVIGATGAQGGSVARHLLQDGKFQVKCLTRNLQSEAALVLKEAGAELVKGDLGDKDSLVEALKGCYGVFGVTNFWEHFEGEYEHGKNLIDAVAESEVEFFVLSSLPSAIKTTNGKHSALFYDLKGKMEDYAQSKGVEATFVHVAFYYENLLSYFPPLLQEDGSYAFGFPMDETPLASCSVEDLGGFISPIFEAAEIYKGKTVGFVGDEFSSAEFARLMTKHLGQSIQFNYIPREVFASFDFPGAKALADGFEFHRLYTPSRIDELNHSKLLYSENRTFEQWLIENEEKFAHFLQGEATKA